METILVNDAFALPPRGMNRLEAARYVGVGTTLFDKLVADGRMPKPRRADGRVIWDREELDRAFSALPRADADDTTSHSGTGG